MNIHDRILNYAADVFAFAIVLAAVELAIWIAIRLLGLKISLQIGGI